MEDSRKDNASHCRDDHHRYFTILTFQFLFHWSQCIMNWVLVRWSKLKECSGVLASRCSTFPSYQDCGLKVPSKGPGNLLSVRTRPLLLHLKASINHRDYFFSCEISYKTTVIFVIKGQGPTCWPNPVLGHWFFTKVPIFLWSTKSQKSLLSVGIQTSGSCYVPCLPLHTTELYKLRVF